MKSFLVLLWLTLATIGASWIFIPAASSYDPNTPSSVSGLKLWTQGDAITGKNDGDTITTWVDSSSNGYNLTSTGSGNALIYKTNIVNGKPVVRFNNGKILTSSPITVGSICSNSAKSSWVVTKITGDPVTDDYLSTSIWTDDTTGVYISLSMASTGPKMIAQNRHGWPPQQVSVNYTKNVWAIFHYRLESNVLYVSINNGTEQSIASGATDNGGSLGNLIVGSKWNGTGDFAGDIAELLIYNVAVGSSDRTLIQNYLNAKYAVY